VYLFVGVFLKIEVDRFSPKIYLITLFIILSALKLFYSPLITGDLFIWVASGLKTLELKSFDLVDSFSIHQNLFINYPSTLSNILYGFVFKIGGTLGLFIFTRLIGIFFILYLAKNYLKSIPENFYNLLLAVGSVVGAFYMLDRPAYLAFVLVAAFIDHILSHEKKVNLFYVFGLSSFWCNIHPSVLIILPFLFYRILIFKNLKSLLIFISALLGIICNPIGLKIFKYGYDTMTISSKRFEGEWSSFLDFHDPSYAVLFLILTLFLLIQLIRLNKWKEYLKSGLIVFWVFCLMSARHFILFSVIFIPTISYFNLWIKQNNIQIKARLHLGITFLCIIILVLSFKYNVDHNQLEDKDSVSDIVMFLQNKKDLRIFNECDGGYISTFLSKNNDKIFLDNRNIIFSDEIYQDYVTIKMANPKNLEPLIKKYSLNAFIVSNENKMLMYAMKNQKDWNLVFSGKNAMVFLKSLY
jgi:hypothetical protein